MKPNLSQSSKRYIILTCHLASMVNLNFIFTEGFFIPTTYRESRHRLTLKENDNISVLVPKKSNLDITSRLYSSDNDDNHESNNNNAIAKIIMSSPSPASKKDQSLKQRDHTTSNNLNIFDPLLKFRQNFSQASKEGFGTKARNVVSTMSVGDIVVPLCGNLEQRQYLANKGIYPGVEYEICSLQLMKNENDDGDNDMQMMINSTTQTLNPSSDSYIHVDTLVGRSFEERQNALAYMKPAYKLRKHLERNDWPVSVYLEEVPLWLSKTTYEAGTMVGTILLAGSYLTLATFFAFFIRFAYVPTESMMPTLNPGDVVLVTRSFPFQPLKPNVGDVVLFDPPTELKNVVAKTKVDNDNLSVSTIRDGQQLLKRIVAVPGEYVGVKNSEPFVPVDDSAKSSSFSTTKTSTDEDSEASATNTNTKTKRQYRVDIVGAYAHPELFSETSWDRDPSYPLGRNQYFVAGDNGYRSVDSRVWGPLDGKYIFGTAKLRLWPLKNFGMLNPGQIYYINK